MRHLAAGAALAALLVALPALAQERRQLDAHVHGESRLAIAIEGETVSMELEAPGNDIVGFEHAPGSDEERARVEEAKAGLADPLALFAPPEAAGCTVTKAEVEHVLGEEEAEEAKAGSAEHAHEGEAAHAHEGEAEEGGHSEFRAAYTLACTDAAALAALDFRFFERFPNAEAVEVQVVSERGQASYEVERESPRLDLSRLGS